MNKNILLTVSMLLSSAVYAQEGTDTTSMVQVDSSHASVATQEGPQEPHEDSQAVVSPAPAVEDTPAISLAQHLRDHLEEVQCFDMSLSIARCPECTDAQWQQVRAAVEVLDGLLQDTNKTLDFRNAFVATVAEMATLNNGQRRTEGRLSIGWDLLQQQRAMHSLEVSEQQIVRTLSLHKEQIDPQLWQEFCKNCVVLFEQPEEKVTPMAVADLALEIMRLQHTAHHTILDAASATAPQEDSTQLPSNEVSATVDTQEATQAPEQNA